MLVSKILDKIFYHFRQDEGQSPQSCRIHKTTDKVGGSLFRPGDLPRSMLCHTAGMTCSILNTWYFLFLLTDGSFIAAAGIWFLGTWLDLLAFAMPLGIGVQEGTRILAFKALGFGLTLGLAYGIALRLQQLFWTGVGLVLYALLLTGKREKRLFSKKGVTSDDPSLD